MAQFGRARPASAGSSRSVSGSVSASAFNRANRPLSAASSSKLTKTSATLQSSGSGTASLGAGTGMGWQAWRVTAREPKPLNLSKVPPLHVWNHIPEPQTVLWTEKWSTMAGDNASCSIPAGLAKAMLAMWRDSVKAGNQFLCILEVCHDCEDHRSTTKHDSKNYQSKANMVVDWITSDFPFVACEQLHLNYAHYRSRRSQLRRVGPFEVYLLFPDGGGSSSCRHYLVHSKLLSSKWPCRTNLQARLKTILPDVVSHIQSISADWSCAEGESLLKEADGWGLGSWDALQDLSEKVRAAGGCLQQGQEARAKNDKEALRESLQQAVDLHIADEAVNEWREDLKQKNLTIFNVKLQARRFQRNAAFSVAVRLLESVQVRPLRVAALQRAIDKAQASEVPEEEIVGVAELQERVVKAVGSLTHALDPQNAPLSLGAVEEALHELEALQVQDEILDQARVELARVASAARRGAEIQDFVELQIHLGGWIISEATAGALLATDLLTSDLADIRSAELVRLRLQKLVDEAETRFVAERWDALQSAVDRLAEVHVDETTWDRWTSALKREQNFTLLKAVSGAGWELKRHLYTLRLESALRVESAPSIPIQQLEAVADAAEAHGVDADLVARARTEVSSVRQRWQTAQDAISRRSVDTAEVMLWKLKAGRVRMEEWAKREGPLWEMVDAAKAAEAAKDWQAMKEAVAGWSEDKPDSAHEAFSGEDSPTRTFRSTLRRIGELHLHELRREVNETLNHLTDQTASSTSREEMQAELQRTAYLFREMFKLGWEMTPEKKARLMILLGKVKAQGGREKSVARLSAALLQHLEGSSNCVFLLDQSLPMKPDTFSKELKPAVSVAMLGLRRHLKDALWGAVAYGPVQVVRELTANFQDFSESVEAHDSAAAGPRMTAKALRKASELFKAPHQGSEVAKHEPARVIFNFTHGAPGSAKDAHKAFRVLEALGVTVVGIGIGKDATFESLSKYSSAGLVFRVETLPELSGFLEDAFAKVDEVLESSQTMDSEAILGLLAESG
ncbi:unnamed protein product [Polarella glacialis]|uniref:VWFA domain-containing protein n=1 Tax=Polarella glacialis TaxID=89957 RepID=A0A813HM37_POLGL|nr:unnamed protein product [Polarella glacialis]